MKIASTKFAGWPPDRREASLPRKVLATNDLELAKLRKACRDFEAIFVSYMLKSMRKATEKSGLFGDGLGSEIYGDIFDEKLAEKMAESGQMKIGDILYKLYTPLVKKGKEADSPYAKSVEKANASISEPAANWIEIQTRRENEPDKTRTVVRIPITEPLEKPGPRKGADSEDPDHLSRFDHMIAEAGRKFGIDTALLKAVIRHESGGNPKAVSPQGAKGLMQLLDSTSKMMGVTDPFNPMESIMGGAKYLSQLFRRFTGDLRKVLASYNAGPAAVEKFDGVPPFAETQKYVERVLATFAMRKKDN